jgi:hypothetical protein
VVAPNSETTRAGRAVITIIEQFGHARLARLLAKRPLVWMVELGYRLVAMSRRYLA